ncbi:nuclear transport factor 2 isoform X2 [Magnolia sinica]|uniref:nuclear transport factor 2 isoform X2 n=1 Tax=Magnolia sinica TaxID=86752 RepID=UPI002659E3CD|nr:nuclear transport factor 2 isoform X2 [Magnolia sinica]
MVMLQGYGDFRPEHHFVRRFTALMASTTSGPAGPGAQVVGNAFVEQYYHILYRSPELVCRFYHDLSEMSRPEPNGAMTSVKTMQAINDKIVSLGYKGIKVEIKTADAQESHQGGVMVLVTGCLTGTDNVRRKFAQSFFLAPQDKGYFVLNDVFRYVDESESVEADPILVNGVAENTLSAPLTPDPEVGPAPDHHVTDPEALISEEDLHNGQEVCDPSDNEEGSVIEEEEVVVEPPAHSSQNEVQQVTELTSTVQEDAPKKSYASIVKVMKDTAGPVAVYVPTTAIWVAPANTERQSVEPPAPAPAPVINSPTSNNTPESSNLHEEAEGHSIYIRGLPLNATVAQLDEEFRKFGPIKPGGIQVRSNRQQGFCFGFVEFELPSSMQNVIEASPIMIGGRQAFIEEKRTTTRGNGSGRGRFPTGGRGAFRNNDSFRGRGSFGNRGYGRSDFGSRGEFSGRGRGPSGRGGTGYQRVDQNGNARAGRSGGANHTAVPV